MFEVAAEVILCLEIALIDGRDEWQLVHVFKDGPGFVVHDSAVGQTIAQTENRLERKPLRDVATREVEFFTAHEVDRIAGGKRAVRIDGDSCPDHPDEYRGSTSLKCSANWASVGNDGVLV